MSKLSAVAVLAISLVSVGCGYSEQEMNAKRRQIQELTDRLNVQKARYEELNERFGEARSRIDNLKQKLKESGINLESLNASLQEQKKALQEYRERTAQLEKIQARFQLLTQKLKKLTDLGLEVVVRDNRMVIRLPGDVLFAPGSADLAAKGKEILGQVAEVLRNDSDLAQREFQVAGHTDAKPLRGGPYKDNWGLSAMRARSVVVFLTKDQESGGGGLDRANWSAAGYSDTDPVAPNDTDENRKKNRRVELVVMPNVEELLDLKSFLEESKPSTPAP